MFLAPILSFTVEEVWEHIPNFKGKEESIHLQNFPGIDRSGFNETDLSKWENLIRLRNNILKEIENARGDKIIGDSLEADIDLILPLEVYNEISKEYDLLKMILVVSGLNISSGNSEKITVKKFIGEKCPRCWNWFEASDEKEEFTGLCPRCFKVIKEMDIELD